MPIKKSRKQRTLENAIRSLLKREMYQMQKEVILDIAEQAAVRISEEAIEDYVWEKNKPTVYDADMVKQRIREDEWRKISATKTSEELTAISTAKTEAVYKVLGVPYGTPLRADYQLIGDTKWRVYPQGWLPKKYN